MDVLTPSGTNGLEAQLLCPLWLRAVGNVELRDSLLHPRAMLGGRGWGLPQLEAAAGCFKPRRLGCKPRCHAK